MSKSNGKEYNGHLGNKMMQSLNRWIQYFKETVHSSLL